MGGYETLLVYRLAVTIYDLNVGFYKRFLSDLKYKRTVEQMHQAARSGKQNIVEGSLEKSTASDMMLVGYQYGLKMIRVFFECVRFANPQHRKQICQIWLIGPIWILKNPTIMLIL